MEVNGVPNYVPHGLAVDLLQDRERRLVLAVCMMEGINRPEAVRRIAEARKRGRVVTYPDYLGLTKGEKDHGVV